MLYTIIDIETTGLNRSADNILEVGYLQMDRQLNIVRSGSFYFYKPEWRMGAQDIHGLTRDFLEKYENDFEDNLVRMYTILQGNIVLGKNSNGFDIPFIQEFLFKYARVLKDAKPRGVLDLQDYYTPKYKMWYKEKYGVATQKRGTLSELIEMIGIDQEELKEEFYQKLGNNSRGKAHCALFDVYMTYKLVEYAVANYGMSI